MSSFYKKYMLSIVTTALFLSLVGCGSGGSSDSSTKTVSLSDTNNSKEISSLKSTGTALTLSGSNVSIYKVKDDSSLSLLWKETTSSGHRLEEIGEFNPHANELTDDDFYLYKVTGGKDWDSDNDGILDENATTNRGVLRSIAQGVDIKKAGRDFKISYATELFYEEVVPTLKRKFDRTTFSSILNNKVSEIIEDSNNIEDILTFNPREDKENLKEFYKIRAKTIVDTIHQGKIPALNMSAILGLFGQSNATQAITLSNDGTKAYLVMDDYVNSWLVVINVSDPTNPTQLGLLKIEALDINSITLSNDGNKAYITRGMGLGYAKDVKESLVIIDISNPNNPIQLGSIDTTGGAYNIVLSDNETKAYLANIDGLLVVDISNSTNPIQLSFFATGEIARDITLSKDGTKAYVAGCNGLAIIDISNPTNPTKVATISLKTNECSTKVTLSNDGTKAYVAGYNGLAIVDISNPTNPVKLGFFNTVSNVDDIRLSNDGTKAYLKDYNNLVVVDISNPSNPIKLGSFDIGGIAMTLSNDSTKAYIASFGGLVVLDISNPINPPKLSSYGSAENPQGIPSNEGSTTNISRVFNTIQNISPILGSYTSENSDIHHVTLSNDGTRAYLIDEYRYDSSLVVIDISNPTHLTKLASIKSGLQNIALSNSGTKAYITSNYNGLIVMDISNPSNLTKVGFFNIESELRNIALSNDDTIGYIADSKNGLIIIDISNPTNPIKLSSYIMEGFNSFGAKNFVGDVQLSNDGTKAYVLDYFNGLVVLDTSSPTNLIKLASLNTVGSASHITLSSDGTKACLLANDLVIIDISNPSNPIQLGSFDTGGSMRSITLSQDGRKAYLAEEGDGLVVVDISSPTNPVKLASYNTEGVVWDVTLSMDGTKAYVADGANGLVVIDLDLYN